MQKKERNDIVITAKEDGELLAYLRRELSNLPSGKIKSYLEHRQISINGGVTTKFNAPVRPGDTLRISMSQGASKKSSFEIVYEDSFLIAINKPAGLLSVASDSEKLRTAYAMLSKERKERIFVVHRLDRDTSGVLLFAKSEEIKNKMQESWEETAIKREYLAICEGVFEKKSGICESTLAENSKFTVFSAKGEGKRAVTRYEVIKDNGDYSAVRLFLETGRKNQIRVHMKELGHPVVGDKKYGAETNPLGRLGLHAAALTIIHPVSGKELALKAKAERKFTLPR